MIVQDVVTRVRRTFGDEAAVQVTDADVIRWINDAQVEIVKYNDSALQATSYKDIVKDQAEYAMPTDLLILRSLRYKFAGMLSYSTVRFKNMQEFDASIDGWDGTLYSSGNPIYFTVYNGIAIVFPPPSESVLNGFKFLYNKKPTDVTGLSDALALPLIYHNTVMKYCMWQASLMDEDREQAVLYRGDFQDDMGMLQNNETQDPVATYPVISVLDYDQ